MSESGVRVRPMTLRDAAAVADLCTQLGYPATTETMERRIAALAGRDDHGLLVATVDGEWVVGWIHVCSAMLIEIDPLAEVWGLVVDAEERGRGVGRLLMEAAERWAIARGHRVLRLRSRVQREGAHRFYERLGYRIAKTSHTFQKQLSPTTGG
jgi:GNAT superfamily N-acetyltransferase